jgi:hypothetical protein
MKNPLDVASAPMFLMTAEIDPANSAPGSVWRGAVSVGVRSGRARWASAGTALSTTRMRASPARAPATRALLSPCPEILIAPLILEAAPFRRNPWGLRSDGHHPLSH